MGDDLERVFSARGGSLHGHADPPLIDKGHRLVRSCLLWHQPGPYQIQAVIAAVHAVTPTSGLTDWSQIVALYDQLLAVRPTPVVALNRAVAVAELEGPDAGLIALEGLDVPSLADCRPFHAARAALLAGAGRFDDAAAAYDRALSLTTNLAERRFWDNGGAPPRDTCREHEPPARPRPRGAFRWDRRARLAASGSRRRTEGSGPRSPAGPGRAAGRRMSGRSPLGRMDSRLHTGRREGISGAPAPAIGTLRPRNRQPKEGGPMPDKNPPDASSSTSRAPQVVAPTNRINVALPFAKIQTHEPSQELAELAQVVAGLASLVDGLAPGTQGRELRRQAQRLAEQLRPH